MKILGIDTTGFSTSIALVEDGNNVLFNYTEPAYKLNKEWKDMVVELPRCHFLFFWEKFEKILDNHNINLEDVDAIAFSGGSGIDSCLRVGDCFATAYAKDNSIPSINVDHILAHMYSTWIREGIEKFTFPILSFSSSGSHNNLALISSFDFCRIMDTELQKEKNEDLNFYVGIGKYFYRVSKLLSRQADEKKAGDWKSFLDMMKKGDPKKYDFKKFHKNQLSFNLSDFFTEVKKFIETKKTMSSEMQNNIAASFQDAVAEIVSDKLLFLAKTMKVNELHFSGGISMNIYIEKVVREKFKREMPDLVVRYPKTEYRLDNAAMIASLAYYQEKYKIKFQGFKPIITK